jgi:hypothetical protein
MSDRSCMLQGGEKEEVSIVMEGDILSLLERGSLKNAEFDYWGRINWTTVGSS